MELRAWFFATRSADVGLLSAVVEYSQQVTSHPTTTYQQPAISPPCHAPVEMILEDVWATRDAAMISKDGLAGEEGVGRRRAGGWGAAGGPGAAAVKTPRRWPARTPDFIRWYNVD